MVKVSVGANGTNLDSDFSLQEARDAIKELRERDFSKVSKASKKEKESSRKAMIIANGLKDKAVAIENRVKTFDSAFKDIYEAHQHLFNESQRTKKTSENASAVIDMGSDIKWRVFICLVSVVKHFLWKGGCRSSSTVLHCFFMHLLLQILFRQISIPQDADKSNY